MELEQKYFTDFETSKLLTELAFDKSDSCNYYSEDGQWMKLKGTPPFEYFTEKEVYAVFLLDVREWLWEKHRIFLEVTHHAGDDFKCAMYEDEILLSQTAYSSIALAEAGGVKFAVEYVHRYKNEKR